MLRGERVGGGCLTGWFGENNMHARIVCGEKVPQSVWMTKGGRGVNPILGMPIDIG